MGIKKIGKEETQGRNRLLEGNDDGMVAGGVLCRQEEMAFHRVHELPPERCGRPHHSDLWCGRLGGEVRRQRC